MYNRSKTRLFLDISNCVLVTSLCGMSRFVCAPIATGVQCIVQSSSGNKLAYVVYNLSSGKLETTCHFSTDLTSFIGQSEHNIALVNADEVHVCMITVLPRSPSSIVMSSCRVCGLIVVSNSRVVT